MPTNKKIIVPETTIEDFSIVYSVLTPEERVYLDKNYKTLKYKKNQIIYQEGENPTGLLCLGSGKVKIFTEGVGGRDQIVRLAKAPDFIGYRALFAEGPHIASAVVIEPCTIFYISKEVIDELLLRNNHLCMNIIKSFASELGFTRFRTVSLTQKHIRGRLAESLMLLKDIYGYEDNIGTLNINLSREDLANFSNMTTSNAIRTLTTFTKEELIKVEGRIIRILDEESLQRISKLG